VRPIQAVSKLKPGILAQLEEGEKVSPEFFSPVRRVG